MRNINLLFSDAKDFLYNEVNRVFIAVILAGVILGYIIYSGNSAILKSNEELLKSKGFYSELYNSQFEEEVC